MTEVPIGRWDLVHLLLSVEDRPRSSRDGADLDAVLRRAVAALAALPEPPAIEVPAPWTAPLLVEGHPCWVMETVSWLLVAGGRCVLVDVPPHPRRLAERIAELGVVPAAIVLTHGHLDHAGGVAELLAALEVPVPVHVHPADRPAVLDPRRAGPLAAAVAGDSPPADAVVDHRPVALGPAVLTPIFVPGHTRGSTVVVVEGTSRPLILSGDVLFAGGAGRCDLHGADAALAGRSLRQLLAGLPDDTVVLPGHGPLTTAGTERPRPPLLRAV
ncbi:MAG TPA: MBL fold metallo-hydrolase [Acidimicrobiales bacterium]|nr:MBL fold metallo-hydrolase [Acidimicrobiales bacterium]